jgi:hypothetical protein
MGKNRRKEKRYIEFRDLRWLVPTPEWGEYLKRKLTVLAPGSKRVARLRSGVKVVWEDGQHLLRDSARGVEVPIPSTWPTEADAIKDDRYIADPVKRQFEILKRYRVERGVWEAA